MTPGESPKRAASEVLDSAKELQGRLSKLRDESNVAKISVRVSATAEEGTKPTGPTVLGMIYTFEDSDQQVVEGIAQEYSDAGCACSSQASGDPDTYVVECDCGDL
jgi:hypothetical protein